MLSVAGLLAISLTFAAGMEPLTESAVLESSKRHVRTTDKTIRQLLKNGYRHSVTFATLLRRLEHSDVIVYIEDMPRLPGALEGRLLILPQAHNFRYVRIQLALHGTPNEQIAVLGHELQHAVEVAENPDVGDEAALAILYKRIGIDQGHNWYDTLEAQDTGKRVLKELAA